jgi:3-isopropylmalate/(R)-2-methylmalate dehydratase large subunit
MGRTLLGKVWAAHCVRELAHGATQLFVGRHFVHEVTSPQAFAMLRERGLSVGRPDLTFATMDHVIPTDCPARPFADPAAETMACELERNARQNKIAYFGPQSGFQGIVHVIGPELGISQPGMTVCCGDSHTCTHGGLGCIAFGIGTSQVRDVLATQTVSAKRPGVRRVEIRGALRKGACAKDVALQMVRVLGPNGGIGFAHEYAGSAVERMGVEERLTLCNMSIEAGARIGYANPDAKTAKYLEGRPYAPGAERFGEAREYWKSVASDADAEYDSEACIDAEGIEPMVSWGTSPSQAIGVSERIPRPESLREGERQAAQDALGYMGLKEGEKIAGTKIDVAFIGSCTNSRISDLRAAARVLSKRRVAKGVRAIAVPGSQKVAAQARAEGIDRVFAGAGFAWKDSPGCSMCIGMNQDRLGAGQVCASSSNRNFPGRQGSASARTLLMGPAMVAAAAVCGEVCDVRDFL